ncbi:UDP-N-acetylglucosamine 1-carboxyvinyltransferase [bacterium]|nr:UDP-N-acetylglucosamine 1-carboxyvinyltransferase [bacterium]
MSRFIIEGGAPLNGTVRPSGNKNEALPVLMACLLTSDTITFERVPRIQDVLTVCQILEEMGVTVEWEGEETLHLTAKNVNTTSPSAKLCSDIRASILLMGPMLARMGRIELPMPGGDVIGARRIDTHWEGIEALGGSLRFQQHKIVGQIKKAQGCDVYMDEPSVTATENLLLLAVMAEGTTVLHNAACEPHVTGLCNLLNAMGGRIEGTGSNRLTIHGVKNLHGARHRIGPDFMEVGSMLCLGAIAGGKVKIEDAGVSDLRFVLKTLARLGIHPTIAGDSLEIDGTRPIVVKKEVSGRVPTIYSGPWPAYPTDLMSVAIVAATQSVGTSIFFEKMFEGRMFFTDKLMQMGANIVLCDPHRVVITGPGKLIGSRMSSPDVRAGMALLMAAAIAEGRSTIDNIHQIERGYMSIDKKLAKLGVKITREA